MNKKEDKITEELTEQNNQSITNNDSEDLGDTGETVEERKNEDNNSQKIENNNDFKENNLENKIEILEEEIEKLRDEKLRLLADMENLRKRSDRDRVDSIRYGCFNLAREVLSPDDNLTRALEAIPESEIKSENIKNLIKGLKMVQKEFLTVLEKNGVKKIESLNKKL